MLRDQKELILGWTGITGWKQLLGGKASWSSLPRGKGREAEAVVWEGRRTEVQQQEIQALQVPDSQNPYPTPAHLPGFHFFTQW